MNVVTVTGPDVNNGNGTRVTCWIAGCRHNCEGCHNKWLQDYKEGKPIRGFKDKIFSMLSLPYIDGITFSGGDPLYQNEDSLQELYDFILEVRTVYPDKNIWIYSGFTLQEALQSDLRKKILFQCDYFVDGKFVKELKDVRLAFRGSSNQKIWHRVDETFESVEDNIFQN